MLRFDDQFPLHRKVDGLTDSAFRLHVEAIFWCARNLTDGFIAQDDLGSVSRFRKPEGYLAECVKRGAWHRVQDGQIQPGCAECAGRLPDLDGDGWVIHGFLDWQLPRSKVLDIRQKRKEAGQAGGIKSGQSRRAAKPAGQPRSGTKREATPKQDAKRPVEPPTPLPSSKEGRGERAAPLGAPLAPAAPPPPVPSRVNGGSSPPKDLLAEVRAGLKAASRKVHASGDAKQRNAFEELLAIPTPQPPAPSDEGPSDLETST